MRKLVGALLVAVSVPLFVVAGLWFVGNVLPAMLAVFQQPSAYAIGYLNGYLVVVVLLVYLGRKALRAGWARFSDKAALGEDNVLRTPTGQPPASKG